jgi:pilus assembly protein CpaB
VLEGAFREVEGVVGQVARVTIVAGEQVIPTKVTETGPSFTDVDNPPLPYVVPEGMRAVSVSISSGSAASGLIRPGDYVDVILSVKRDTGGTTEGETSDRSSDQIAVTILQNVQVLSIGQDVALTSTEDNSGSAPTVEEDTEANPDAGTATLAVTPVHGEVLIAAELCGDAFGGRLSLALRGFGDATEVPGRGIYPSDGSPPTCDAILGSSGLQ